MTKKFLAVSLLALVVCLGVGTRVHAAKEYDPEIKEYLKQLKERRQEEEKAERKARWDDPQRLLRPYQTLDEINDGLDQLVAGRPELLSAGTYGKSVEGRDLRFIKLSSGPGDKVEVLVAGNIHAQEFAAGQVAIAILEHLVQFYGRDRQVTWLVDNADIYFTPLVNPDGFHKCAQMQKRYGITTFIRKNKNEVDLNRNFPYPIDGPDRVKDSAGSPKKISQTHRGPAPLSEPEARFLIAFVEKHDFLAALNYHTAGGLILYPPGTYPEHEPDTELMAAMAQSYRERQFDKYEASPGIDLYPTLGAIDDYLYHRYGILAFTVEVGKHMGKRGRVPRNGSFSPIFWAYNVYYLDREKANNVPGAMALIEHAIKVHQQPQLRKWKPSENLWVGEPPRPNQ